MLASIKTKIFALLLGLIGIMAIIITSLRRSNKDKLRRLNEQERVTKMKALAEKNIANGYKVEEEIRNEADDERNSDKPINRTDIK